MARKWYSASATSIASRVLQCDRATNGAEMADVMEVTSTVTMLQCDRATNGAEIAEKRGRVAGTDRFNVTAPRMARKSHRQAHLMLLGILLQCDCATNGAEVAPGPDRLRGQGRASMWPRHEWRGNCGLRRWHRSSTASFNVTAPRMARK